MKRKYMKKDRIVNIIKTLLETDAFISAEDLSEQLKVSKRTIYSDLDSPVMKKVLHGAEIIKKPKQGIRLSATAKQISNIKFDIENNALESSFNKLEEDVQKFLILLLTQQAPITLETISRYLYRSMNSILHLINQTNDEIKMYHCSIEKKPNYGIWLKGTEENIQKMFRKKCVSQFALETIFPKQIVDTAYQVCSHAEILLNTKFTDYDYKKLLCKVSILIERALLGYHYNYIDHINTQIPEYYISANMKMEIEYSLQIQLTEEDKIALTCFLLKTRKTISGITTEAFNEELVDTFIRKISEKLNCPLENDVELKINLLNHLKPAIRRLRYGVPSENPLLDRIRYDYSYAYIAVMMTIDEIESIENIFFDTNELSFVCMHIVAALNRINNQRSFHVLLVNNDGLSVQTFLKSMIEKHFSELQVETCDSYTIPDQEYDIIFNSTQKKLDKNFIQISSLLDEKDLSSIRHWLFSLELDQVMSIQKNLHKYVLFFHDHTVNKFDLLKKYSNFLQETGYVTKDFYTSVIEREKYSSTSIGRAVAVPHGAKDTVLKSVIVLIELEKPILWDDLEVDTIFLTAINSKNSKEFSHFFKTIFDVVSNEQKLKHLKQAKDIDEIETLLFSKSSITNENTL